MQGFWEGFSHSLPKTAELPGQEKRGDQVTGETPRPQGSQFSAGSIDLSQAQLKAGIPQPETSQLPSLAFTLLYCVSRRSF